MSKWESSKLFLFTVSVQHGTAYPVPQDLNPSKLEYFLASWTLVVHFLYRSTVILGSWSSLQFCR